jgi:hypothetical protein
MALNDVVIYEDGAVNYPGDIKFAVAASATLINKGEPTLKTLGNTTGYCVSPLTDAKPQSSAAALTAGIAASTSTNTASAVGSVQVTKLDPKLTYLCAPTVAASWDTQAKYDALVGARVTFNLASSVYKVNATDNAAYGLVVQPLDINAYPGKVRFSIRPASTYLGFATGIS